jgi:hypothetical protein
VQTVIRFLIEQGIGVQAQVRTTTVFVAGTWYVLTIQNSGAGNAAGISIAVNGVAETLATVSDNLTGATTSTAPFTISGRDVTGTLPCPADYGEIIANPSAPSLTSQTNYLRTKWGTP